MSENPKMPNRPCAENPGVYARLGRVCSSGNAAVKPSVSKIESIQSTPTSNDTRSVFMP